MKLLAVFLLVMAVVSFFNAVEMRPPEDMSRDEALGFMVGTMIVPAMFAAAGIWCLLRKGKTAESDLLQKERTHHN